MTWESFEVQMERLGGLKFRPPTLQTHWEALKDMPSILLDAAIAEALKETDEYPSPRMLKVCADKVRARVLPVEQEEDRSAPITEPLTATLPTGKVLTFGRVWKYYCDRCSDTGWASYWCGERHILPNSLDRYPWLDSARCQRHKEHGAHDWSGPCACAESNPAVLRRKEREAQGPRRGARDGE